MKGGRWMGKMAVIVRYSNRHQNPEKILLGGLRWLLNDQFVGGSSWLNGVFSNHCLVYVPTGDNGLSQGSCVKVTVMSCTHL